MVPFSYFLKVNTMDIDTMMNMFIRNRTPKYREPGVLGGPSQSAPNLAQIPQVGDDQDYVLFFLQMEI